MNQQDVKNKDEKVEINVIPNGQYLKRKEFLGLKSPYEMSLIEHQEKPQSKIDINLTVNPQNEDKGIYEVVICAKATPNGSDDELFRGEIVYAGLFTISNNEGISNEIREQILMIHYPPQLFPYVKKEVSAESVEAGFAPLVLSDVDFVAMYKTQKEQVMQV